MCNQAPGMSNPKPSKTIMAYNTAALPNYFFFCYTDHYRIASKERQPNCIVVTVPRGGWAHFNLQTEHFLFYNLRQSCSVV